MRQHQEEQAQVALHPRHRRRVRKPVGELCFNWGYLLLELATRVMLGLGMFLASRISPFERQVYGQDWYNHGFPYAERQRVSEGTAALLLGACLILIPVAVLITLLLTKKIPRNLAIEEAINFLLGVSMAILLAAFATEVIKNTYGRPRPDFLSRCFGNDRTQWPITDLTLLPPIPECTNTSLPDWEMKDGRKSFPSGHSSLSFAVYLFLGLFGYRKLSQLKNSGSLRIVWPTCATLFAGYIGVTRTQDYRHFPTDVLAGAILGSFIAYMTWRFYDNIMEMTYVTYRARYGVDWDLKDMFHSSVPAMYTPEVDEGSTQSLLPMVITSATAGALEDGHHARVSIQDEPPSP